MSSTSSQSSNEADNAPHSEHDCLVLLKHGERHFECSFCHAHWATEASARLHVSQHIPIVRVSIEEVAPPAVEPRAPRPRVRLRKVGDRWRCDLCQRTYGRRDTVLRHRRIKHNCD